MDSIRMSPSPIQNHVRQTQTVVQQHPQNNQQTIEMQYQQPTQYAQQPPNLHQSQMKMHNNIINQPPSKMQMQPMGPRSPLLENHQELYGTKQPSELSRQYALREQMQMAAQRAEHEQQQQQQQQQQNIPYSNSSYSIPSPSQDPILSAVIPPGFNASVHQAYLRRNQHQFDPQQIYQNHQNLYSPTSPGLYQPYSARMQQQSNYLSSGHSHTQILRQQYNELQQMKLHQQMQYQTQAQIQQQHTFAQRQILHQHLHSRQQSQQNLSQYGTVPNLMQRESQLTDSQYFRKNDDITPSDDYAYHPSPTGKVSQKQSIPSPSMNHVVNNVSLKSECEMSSPSSKSPSGSESRRSSSGTTQALRSPIAQRPLTAPVSMAGWLYKQGSDGLKVWRKRWFVLSEYCLFYYKSQEEDKLLGSVLLPSYQVSVCTSDDKVLRKFAFKCEHTNMRTYILAAPDREQMNRWMNALTMAALMQEGSACERISQTQTSQHNTNNDKKIKPLNNSGEQNEEIQEMPPGIQPTYENAPPKPRRSNEGYNSPSPERAVERYDSNYGQAKDPNVNNSNQINAKTSGADPIYEPKAATVTSNYASQRQLSKSPEPVYNAHNLSLPLKNTASNRLDNNKSPYNYQDAMSNRTSDNNENRQIQNKSVPYIDNRNNYQQDNSPYNNYAKEKQKPYVESGYQKMVQQQEYKNENSKDQYPQEIYLQNHVVPHERQAFERRTPDTYGRSAIVPGYYNKGRTSDYEDVYNNSANDQNFADTYQRSLSPLTYEDRKMSSQHINQKYDPTTNENSSLYPPSSLQMRQKKIPHNYTAPVLPYNTVPRPHSADFLEYVSKNPVCDASIPNKYSTNASRQPQRPKSSLDINNYDYNGDSYYYSEASYAEKMRQSAHYLRSKTSGNSTYNSKRGDVKSPDFVSHRKMSAPTFRINDGSNYDDMRMVRDPIYGSRDQNKNNGGMGDGSGINSNWTLRNKSLSHIPLHDDVYNRSNSAMSEGSTVSGYNKDQLNENGDLFIRSASARLPASDPITSKDGERKVQQREESMKRLLEWKQRMLQSPLTRKTTPATLSLARSLNLTKPLTQSQGLNDRYGGPSGQTFPKSTSKHSNHHTVYNSYSSDDEERLADSIAGEPSTTAGQRQAGRSPTPPPIPTPSTISTNKQDAALIKKSTPTLDTETNQTNVTITDDSNFSLSTENFKDFNDSYDTTEQNDLKTSSDILVINKTISSSHNCSKEESDNELEYTDADLDEVLALYDENAPAKEAQREKKLSIGSDKTVIENNPLKETYSDYELCEINQADDDDNKTVRNKVSTPVCTPPNPDICENHYLPMSPRKVIVKPEPAHIEIIKSAFAEARKLEDNSYVEMSHGCVESAFSNEETQAYEIVCVSSGKIEPVYMELNNITDKNILNETHQGNDNEMNSSELNIIPVPKSILRKQKSDSKLSVKSSIRNDVKSPLPDILIASQNKEFANKSDSSDADDEGSKDFSLHTAYSRFSLSDNFRPASYYLRSKNVLSDLQDSSDSDVLSPPPIPMTSPPVEDLEISDNSLQRDKMEDPPIKATINISQSELPERKSTSLMDYGNTPSMYDTIFKGERVKRNRISLPDNEKTFRNFKENECNNSRSSLDLKLIPPSYKTSGNTETDSLLSYNADRGSSRMSLESDISSKFDISTVGGSYPMEERPHSVITTDTMSLNESDFVEMQHAQPQSDIELEKLLKRRPLSEDSCFEIESLNENLNETDDINLDDYLNELQSGNLFPGHNMYPLKPYESNTLDKKSVGYLNDRITAIKEEVQYENINLSERSRSRNSNVSNATSDPDTISTFQTVYSLQRTSARNSPSITKFEKDYSSRSDSRNSLPINTNVESPGQTRRPLNHTRHASFEQPTISYYTKNTSPTANDASILKNLNRYKNHEDSVNKVNISEMTKIKSSKSAENLYLSDSIQKSTSNLIFQNRDNSAEQSAPYYYSDLSSQDNLNLSGSSLTSYNKNIFFISNKLNNQRRKGPVAKKCDISHIHNPIHSSTMYNDTVGQDDAPNLIAAAARCVSVEFLSAADKIADIDDKNIYESSSLRQQKIKDAINPHAFCSKNIYLLAHDKTSSFQSFDESSSSDQNKSWEQIINSVVSPLQARSLNQSNTSQANSQLSPSNLTFNNLAISRSPDVVQENNTSNNESNAAVNLSKNSNESEDKAEKPTYDGEMMWDEDALWRENLRRVSHRHARSLDHLDCLQSAENISISGRCSVDLKNMLVSSNDAGVAGNTNFDKARHHTKITRDVTYVNDNVKTQRHATAKRKHYRKKSSQSQSQPPQAQVDSMNENDVYVQLALNTTDKKNIHIHDNLDDGVYEQLTIDTKSEKNNSEENSTNGDGYFLLEDDTKNEIRKKFEIDREKLRQWDLMSSGLMKNESSPCVESEINGGAAEGGSAHTTTTTPSASVSIREAENARALGHSVSLKKSFTGSNPSLVRTNSRDISIPVRAVSPRVRSSSAQPWNSQNNQEYDTWSSQTQLQNHIIEDNWSTVRSPSRQSTQPIRAVSPRVRRASDVEERTNTVQANYFGNEPVINMNNLSAGELLGRTHEELVLLLIQLRRKHTATANAIDQCCTQIKSVQNRINMSEMLDQKQENLQRLEQLKHHLMELEKHYEKSKPLVHLVDNMVKLGTLYNRGPGGSVPSTLDRLEYNQMIRERALMEQAAEQRRWAESSENLPREHIERRVEELRAMERWVAGEAGTIRGLKQERESISGPALQQDLSRVHAMLAINSKKLEQTVAGNARLEQELMVLRQKLQQQQTLHGGQNINLSSSSSDIGIDARTAADATALLEDELRRVQQLVGDLQKQRQELSVAVRQLTDKSQSLGLISPPKSSQLPSAESTYIQNGLKDSSGKVRNNSIWLETDLDNNTFIEHGTSNNNAGGHSSSTKKLTPLYIDTQSNSNFSNESKDNEPSPVVSDELTQNNMFNNLTNVEKQEIKTVRIVKRESERRQRDRERSHQPGNSDWNSQQTGSILDQLVEEDNLSSYQNRTTSLPRGFQSHNSYTSPYTNDNVNSKLYYQNDNTSSSHQYRSQTNPPNTLSLTNVNIPFESMSTSSANSSNKYLSSPSLNNNDYLSNHKDSSNYYTSKYGYSDHYSTSSSMKTKESVSRSIPYLDSPTDIGRPLTNGPISLETSKNGSVSSLSKGNAELSPVFTSETARQIIIEMAGEKNGFVQNNNGAQHRRQVPKEKRRHYTAPHDVISKTLEKSGDDDIFYQEKWWRARDDVDMERVLRSGTNGGSKHGPPPLVAPPDVVRSTLPTGPMPEHYSEHTIDRLLAAPNKILIPERYIPEQAPELSPEEQKKRKEKVESIKKMLSSTTTSSSDPNKSPDVEDKRQREHLLQLNQILAKQVMEMSKIVAVKALETLPADEESDYNSEDLSPDVELPLYQQRDNYFT